MTAYFRKSFKIAPGVHLNLSKRGTGVSFGGRGAHVSFSPTGRITKTVGIPGTGIYYRDVDTLHAKSVPTIHQVEAIEHHGFYISHGVAGYLSLVVAIILNVRYGSDPINPWVPVLVIFGVISLLLWLRDLVHSKREKRESPAEQPQLS